MCLNLVWMVFVGMVKFSYRKIVLRMVEEVWV